MTVTPAAFAAPAAPASVAPELIPASLIAPASLISPASLINPLAQPLELLTVPQSVKTITAASRLIAAARSHLGARYVHGATGPRVFDCIGLVLRSFSQAGLSAKIGGWSNRSGYSLLAWARRHHLTSATHGQPGDVVVWGGGGHVGIYLGNGMAISALTNGVRIHGIHAVTKRFTTFIHTGLTGLQVKSIAKAPAQKTKSIGTRHAGPSLKVRTSHETSARTLMTLKAGTKLTLVQIWKDAKGHVWYRVNANRHVGWVPASGTRP